MEFLCNECCDFGCAERRACYEAVSRQNLGEDAPEHRCAAPDGAQGYRFSKAMKNPGFIGAADIRDIYLPMGFSHFKIEGRTLGSAVLLEFLLHYLTRPEYHLPVREEIYLDGMLDLFRNFTKDHDKGKACKNLVKNVLALFTMLYYNHDKKPVCCLRFCYFYPKRV